jgi:hypothetical protein
MNEQQRNGILGDTSGKARVEIVRLKRNACEVLK